MEKIYLTINEAVEYLQGLGLPVKKSTLYKQTMDRTIKFYRFGGQKIVIKVDDLREWIESRFEAFTEDQYEMAKTVAESARNKERRS
ncbi:hypothetical protein DSECCO2_146830 [anaerobic digester metagenome]|jgi:excisionase family DNA binding protein